MRDECLRAGISRDLIENFVARVRPKLDINIVVPPQATKPRPIDRAISTICNVLARLDDVNLQHDFPTYLGLQAENHPQKVIAFAKNIAHSKSNKDFEGAFNIFKQQINAAAKGSSKWGAAKQNAEAGRGH